MKNLGDFSNKKLEDLYTAAFDEDKENTKVIALQEVKKGDIAKFNKYFHDKGAKIIETQPCYGHKLPVMKFNLIFLRYVSKKIILILIFFLHRKMN